MRRCSTRRLAARSRLADLSALVLAGALIAIAGTAAAGPPPPVPLKDWPCAHATMGPLTVEQLYGKPLPGAAPAADAWQADAQVRPVVAYAAATENTAAMGIEKIAALAVSSGPRRNEAMLLTLSGIVERVNILRRMFTEGIGDQVTRSRLIAEKMAENDRALAALPNDGSAATAEKRKGLETAQFWDRRELGDTGDTAELLCHRLAYMTKKAQALADAIRQRIDAP